MRRRTLLTLQIVLLSVAFLMGCSAGTSDTGTSDTGGFTVDITELDFWRESDELLEIYVFHKEPVEATILKEILSISRSQMSADFLHKLEIVNTLPFYVGPYSYWPTEFYGDGYPDCLDGDNELSYIAQSSGQDAQPVVVAGTNTCGTILVFQKNEINGVVDFKALEALAEIIRE